MEVEVEVEAAVEGWTVDVDIAADAPERWLLVESGDRGGPGFLHSQVSISSDRVLAALIVLDSSGCFSLPLPCCSASSFWMLVPFFFLGSVH